MFRYAVVSGLSVALLGASLLNAQVETTTTPAITAPSKPVQPAVTGRDTTPLQKRHKLAEVVKNAYGDPVQNATVIVSNAASPRNFARTTTTDSLGQFVFDSLPAGKYQLQIVQLQAARPFEKSINVDGSPLGSIVIPPMSEPSVWWTILFLSVYWLLIIGTRWHHIARSINEMLQGQLLALATRIDIEADPDKQDQTARLKTTLDEVRKAFSRPVPPEWWRVRFQFGEFMYWSRGRENAAWVAIHEIERQLASLMAPPERVNAHLHWAEAQLRVIDSKPAIAMADAVVEAFKKEPPSTQIADERRELLGRAISVIYADRDTMFATMMEWHNKATWLIATSLIMIGFLSLGVGHSILFLAGAAGGLLSRVMRALRRDDVPLDYGASWTTLFMSPLFGALAGWFGVIIIILATSPGVNLLGDAFKMVNWNAPSEPVTLAVAFLLGFSERMFDAIVGAVEGQAIRAKSAEQAAKSSPSTIAAIAARAGTTGAANSDAPPPASAGGFIIVLPPEKISSVQPISGQITLEKAKEADVIVTFTSNNAEYEIDPASLQIPVGTLQAAFLVVPKGHAAPAVVRITATIGSVTISNTIEFG